MRLYLFRHGIARDAHKGEDDAARPLTQEGARLTTAAAQGLAQLIDRPDVILSSPRLRALQTAELLGQVFDRKPEILKETGVDAPAAIIHHLRKRDESSIIVVGHEPTLGTLAQQLVAGVAEPCGIELKKAGCAFLEIAWGKSDRPVHAMLHWLVTPAILRAMHED
jgi:phosphohistidine phosphatase